MPRSLVKNTLISAPFLDRLVKRGIDDAICTALVEPIIQFQQMRAFASEIHTELHLVKPILKVLGYTAESKPKFFEEQIKGADFALFKSDEDRVKSSPQWGTRSYYDRVQAVLLVKRYGRRLTEGISGFFLEFESRIPLYQLMYLTKKSGTPWGILTNGKSWVLLEKPLGFEKRVLEIDLETAVANNDEESLALFYGTFSSAGLETMLPDLLDGERTDVIGLLKDKRRSIERAMPDFPKRTESYSIALRLYKELFPKESMEATQAYQNEARVRVNLPGSVKELPLKCYDQCEILSYLLTESMGQPGPDFEAVLRDTIVDEPVKENLLGLKILDMTCGFGNVAAQLVEAVAYLSFLLPYREKRSFVAEWENERLLHKYILDHVLYGIEKYHPALDVLQNGFSSRFNCSAKNFRIGNPLLGMSMSEVCGFVNENNHQGILTRDPRETVSDFKEMYGRYFSLSDRIKEDAAEKNELGLTLRVYRQRMRETMNLMTASYFDNSLENKEIRELLYFIEGEEDIWETARSRDWFISAGEIARRKGFFHMEIEFPFLLNEQFDLVVIQPALRYAWEDAVPAAEVAKAYIKRAMTYLKQTGKAALVGGDPDELMAEFKKSRRYAVETREGVVMVRRR